MVGPDFALGHKRHGTIQVLQDLGLKMGFWVHVVEPQTQGDQVVRSRSLRQMLSVGEVEAAVALLGRRYGLTGTVAHGDARGRELGFPTANLLVDCELLIPAMSMPLMALVWTTPIRHQHWCKTHLRRG